MENTQLFLLVLQVIIAVSLILLVLIQKSDGDSLSGISGGSGGMNAVISSKASANILTKVTMTLAALFMLNCLILASISTTKSESLKEELKKAVQEQELQNKDKKPAVPEI